MSKRLAKSMHDIPLSIAEEEVPNAGKVPSKTNSLKRFFKLNSKTSPEAVTPSGSGGEVSGEAKKDMRRFHLRVGSMRKLSGKSSEMKPATSTLPSTSSNESSDHGRLNLKSSLSNYWSSVFKLRKDTKSKQQKAGPETQVSGMLSDDDSDDTVVPAAAAAKPSDAPVTAVAAVAAVAAVPAVPAVAAVAAVSAAPPTLASVATAACESKTAELAPVAASTKLNEDVKENETKEVCEIIQQLNIAEDSNEAAATATAAEPNKTA